MKVTVSAEEGTFPEGASLVVRSATKKEEKQAGKLVEKVRDSERSVAASYTFDISIVDENGGELQPAEGKTVNVSFKTDEVADKKLTTEVFHINDDSGKAEALDVKEKGKTARVEVEGFSIYVVEFAEDGETVTSPKMVTYNFYEAADDVNSGKVFHSQKVKAGDTLYMPSTPNVPKNSHFDGWYINGDRSNANNKLFSDGKSMTVTTLPDDDVTVVAVSVQNHYATFYDENGTTIVTRKLINDGKVTIGGEGGVKVQSGDAHKRFVGWKNKDADDSAKYTVDELTGLDDDIELQPVFETGIWINFKKNCEDATIHFIPSLFVPTGSTAQAALDAASRQIPKPDRNGYDFKYWSTDKNAEAIVGEGETEPYNNSFNWNSDSLGSDNINLYARYSEGNANYSIVVWKQNVDGTGYDYYDYSKKLSGVSSVASAHTGSTVNLASNDVRLDLINNADTKDDFTGFYLDRYDSSVQVEGDNSSVINIYYNRKTVTYYFLDNRSRNLSGTYGSTTYENDFNNYPNNRLTYTGFYGASLPGDWPTYGISGGSPASSGTNAQWREYTNTSYGYSNNVGTKVLVPNSDAKNYAEHPETEMLVYLYSNANASNQNVPYYMLVEGAEGNPTVTVDGKSFGLGNGDGVSTTCNTSNKVKLAEKFYGYKLYKYCLDYRSNGTNNWQTATAGENTSSTAQSNLYVVYVKNESSILFVDSFDVTKTARPTQTHKYLDNISSVNSLEPTISHDGYEFNGWYLDKECKHKYNATTMPGNSIELFAGWKKAHHYVQVDLNGGSIVENSVLAGAAEIDGKRTFHVAGVETIDEDNFNNGINPPDGYKLVKWENAKGESWNFSDPVTKSDCDSTVNVPQEKQEEYGSEELDSMTIKPVWRLTGTIQIKYNASPGTLTHADENVYQFDEDAQAVVYGIAEAPAGQRFVGWEDSKGNTYETGAMISLTRDIMATGDDGNATVTLTAVYEGSTPVVTVTYDANYSGADPATKISDGYNTNDVATLEGENCFTREGYTLDGWATSANGDKVYDLGQKVGVDEINAATANVLYAHWVEHIHNWTYEVSDDGKTITANCDAAGHSATVGSPSVTLVAPAATTYSGSTISATLSGASAFNIATGEEVAIVYYMADENGNPTGAALSSAPTNAGKYVATVTLSNNTQAKLPFEITKNETNGFNGGDAAAPTISDWNYDGKNATDIAHKPSGPTGNEFGEVRYVYEKKGEGDNWSDVSAADVKDAGTYRVKAVVTGTDNYNGIDSAYTTFTISKVDPAVTEPAGKTGLTYDKSKKPLVDAGSTSDGTVYYRLGESGEWTTDVPEATNAGDYKVYWYVAGDKNHNDNGTASTPNGPIEVSIATATEEETAFADAKPSTPSPAPTYDGNAKALAVAPAANNVPEGYTPMYHFKYENGTFSDWSATVPTGTNAGTYTVEYYFKGDSNHKDVTPTSNSFTTTIGKATLTVKANDKEIIYGNAPANAGVSYSGFVEGEDESKLTGTAAFAYTYEQYGNVGEYAITPSGLSSSNYKITFVDGKLTVKPKKVTFTWPANPSYTGSEQTMTPTIVGLENSDAVTAVCTDTSKATNRKTDGDYEVSVSGLSGEKAGNYVIEDNEGTASHQWNIEKSANTITGEPAIEGWTYGEGAKTPSGVTASSNNVVYKYSTSKDGTYSDAVPTDAGTYWVKAFAAETDNYQAAESEAKSFEIAKKTLTVAWLANNKLTYNGQLQTFADASIVSGILEEDKGKVTVNVTGNTGTETGNYTATVTITGPLANDGSNNYQLAEGGVKTASMDWSIVKADATPEENYRAPGEKTGLVYNGGGQDLVQASTSTGTGTTSDGTMKYYATTTKLADGATVADVDAADWSEDVPQGTDADTYYVYYYVTEGKNYKESGLLGPIETVIAQKALNKEDGTFADGIQAKATDTEYTGSPQTAEIAVTYNPAGITNPTITLKQGTGEEEKDYTVTGATKTDVGDYAVTITGTGNYIGSITVPWNITKKAPGELTDETKPQAANADGGKNLVYNGKPQCLVSEDSGVNPEGGTIYYQVKDSKGNVVSAWSANKLKNEDGTSANNKPYVTDAGKYTVEYYVKGDDNHSDLGSESQVKGSFEVTIEPKTLTASDVTFAGTEFTYNNTPQGPAITVKDTVGGSVVTLTVNTDYTLTDAAKTEVGTYTAKVTGTGNYTGEITQQYAIKKADTAFSRLTDDQKPTANKDGEKNLVYNGQPQTLVKAPEGDLPEGYTGIQYNLDGKNWSDDIPVGTDAKTYNVYYKVVGDANHNDIDCGSIQVVIDPKPVIIKAKDQVIAHDGTITQGVKQVTVGELAEGQSLSEITLTQSTEAEGTIGTIEVTGAKITDAENNDVTLNYAITYDNDGKLTIKASQEAPSDEDKNDLIKKQETTSITINTQPGYEYVLSTSKDAPAANADWSTLTDETVKGYYKENGNEPGTRTFTGLETATKYYVHMRKAETEADETDPGKDPSLSVTVPTSTRPDAPEGAAEGYTVDYGDESLTAEEGFEIFDPNANNGKGAWVNKVEDFVPGGDYQVRVAGKDGVAPSESVDFKAPARPAAPNAVNKTDKTDTTITIKDTVKTQEYLVLPAKDDGTAYTDEEIETLFKAGKGTDGNGGDLTFEKDSQDEDIQPGKDYVIYNRLKAVTEPAEGKEPALASKPAGPTAVKTKNASEKMSDDEKTAIKDTWNDETAEPNSITVKGTDGYEYLVVPKGTDPKDVDWSRADKCPDNFNDDGVKVYTKDSNGNDIAENTDYEILVRKAETDTEMPSEPETVKAYTTRPAPEDGEGYKADYPKELIEVEEGYEIHVVSPEGTEPSKWTGGEPGEDGMKYVPLVPGAKYEIRKKADSPKPGDHESEPATFTTAERPEKPAPVAENEISKKDTSITVNPTDEAQEYMVLPVKTDVDGNVVPYTDAEFAEAWKNAQEGNGGALTFNKDANGNPIAEQTEYVVYNRVKATDSNPHSEPAVSEPVKTKESQTAPTSDELKDLIKDQKATSITINTKPGYEYVITTEAEPPADDDWSKADTDGYHKENGDEPGTYTFADLDPAKKYYIHVRKAETDEPAPGQAASPANKVETQTRNETPDPVSSDNIKTKTGKDENGKDTSSITIDPTEKGNEYIVVPKGTDPADYDWTKGKKSENGEPLTFDGLTPGQEYEVVVRKAATDPGEASEPAKPTSVTTPRPSSGGSGGSPAPATDPTTDPTAEPKVKEESGTSIVVKAEPNTQYLLVPKGTDPAQLTESDWEKAKAGEDGEAIFTGLEPETEYVLVARKTDENGNGIAGTTSDPVNVTTDPSGQYESEVQLQKGLTKVTVKGVNDELTKYLCSDEERAQVKDGQDARVFLKMTDLGKKATKKEANLCKKQIKKKAGKGKVAKYYDLSLYKQVGNSEPVVIHSTKDRSVTVTIQIPKKLKNKDKTKKRTFYVFRVHDGKLKQLAKTTKMKVKIKTNKFSTYTIAYSDVKVAGGTLLMQMTSKGARSMNIQWTKVKGADGYEIYLARCNSNGKVRKCKKVKTFKGNKTFKWTKGLLMKNTSYKGYVKAYVMNGSKKKYISSSKVMHAFTGNGDARVTNPEAVKLARTKFTLKKGQTAKLKGKVTGVIKGRPSIGDNHAPRLRYISANKKIVTVDQSGRIKAKAKGKTKVYVIAINGVRKAATVKVK